MKIKLLFATLFVTFFKGYAQTYIQSDWLWSAKVENTSILENQPLGFIDKNNNHFMVGHFRDATTTIQGITLQQTNASASTMVGDAFIAKFDVNGVVSNVMHFSGSLYEQITSIAYDGNDHFYITGNFKGTFQIGNTTLTASGQSASKVFIAKLTLSGDPVWIKELSDYVGSAYLKYKNNYLYLAANYSSDQLSFEGITLPMVNYNPTIVTMDKNLVAKFDASNGNMIWASSSRYTGPYTTVSADRIGAQMKTMTVDDNGNVYVAGDFMSRSVTFGDITLNRSSSTNANIFYVRYDNTGAVAWAKTIVTSAGSDSKTFDIEVDSSNDVYLAGAIYRSGVNFEGTILQFPGNYGGFLVKYNTAGNVIWAKRGGISSDEVPNTAIGSSRYSKIHIDAQDNIYVGGYFYKYLNLAPQFVYNLDNTFYLMLAKYNKQGAVQSCEIYPSSPNGVGHLEVLSAAADNFKVISSASIDFQLNNLTIETNQKQTLYIAKKGETTAGTDEFGKATFAVYPNPASNAIYIKNHELLSDNAQYIIYDLNGRQIVKTKGTAINEKGIDVSKLAGGIYILTIEDAQNNIMEQLRFIKNN